MRLLDDLPILRRLLGVLPLILLTSPAYACEPLVPFMILFQNPVALGLFKGLRAPLWGVLLLLAIMGLKIVVFFLKSRFRSPWAVGFMILANLMTTLIGAMVAFLAAAPAFLALPCVLFLFLVFLPAVRSLKENQDLFQGNAFPKIDSPSFAATLLTLMAAISGLCFLWLPEMEVIHVPWLYWPLKIVLCAVAILLSLFIGVIYEERIIAGLYGRLKGERVSFLEPVFWSNVAGITLALTILAVPAFIERLKTEDFLIDRHHLSSGSIDIQWPPDDRG